MTAIPGCPRCHGTGMVELIAGTHSVTYWSKGEPRTVTVEATEEKPVYKRCGCATVEQVK